MYRRSNTQASSLVVLLSILTILAQFITYELFEFNVLIWGISCLISIICCHILLEQTATYRICFDYSILTLFISLVIIILTHRGNMQTFLPYTNTMLGIAFINWLIPMAHCFIRHMLDYGTKVDEFRDFYRYSSILFLIFYTVVIINGNFAQNAFPWAYQIGVDTTNVIPFGIISSQIEDYLYGFIPLRDIVIYLASRILIYIPYGFYITLVLRGQRPLIRFLSFLCLPFFIEVLQYITMPARCDIDDLIYAFAGGLLGCAFFFLTNVIFRAFSGNDFLMKGTEYRIYHNTYHF